MALGRFLTPTSCRPSRVLSNRANTTNASSSCCIPGGTSASPSIALQRGQVFRGPGFRNGSLTRINLHHCLACRRQYGDASFVFSLSHQFVTSPQARVLHHQAIRRPLVSCIVPMQPSGCPSSLERAPQGVGPGHRAGFSFAGRGKPPRRTRTVNAGQCHPLRGRRAFDAGHPGRPLRVRGAGPAGAPAARPGDHTTAHMLTLASAHPLARIIVPVNRATAW